MTERELENYLQAQIPMTKNLGLKVILASEEKVEVLAPLEPNRNHLGTAFGGSLNSVLLLACYTWIFNALHNKGYDEHVVLKQSSIQYFFPVDEDFKAICVSPPSDELKKFLQIHSKKGKARILLTAHVMTSQGIACALKGEFVTVGKGIG